MNNNVPNPIINDHRLRNGDGSHVTVSAPYKGDHFDLTTGDITVARVIGGKRYDTAQATLIASEGVVDTDTGGYRLKRLYRANHGGYFTVRMEWENDIGFGQENFISSILEDQVLGVARMIVQHSDCLRFLREWYCAGWIPRNDIQAQEWAEDSLPADDCEAILFEFIGGAHPF
ncbi:MAG: hypothetical protein ACYDC8_17525 [Gammaproteobacteria bacterium]